MSWDEVESEPAPEYPGPGDDPAVRELEPQIVAYLDGHAEVVFYETQLAVIFERNFFHWVTSRALKDLREANKVGSALEELSPNVPIRFYFSRRCRYWKRKSEELRRVVLTFSDQAFTRALGVQGELLIDSGLPQVGFMPAAREIRSWESRNWTETNHNLDRVFQRDGISYGTEIKNRLGYIPQDEFKAKLRMCKALNLVPLFIARMMPKTYIDEVYRAGGFSLIMKYQFYPIYFRDLARRVSVELSLPVDCPARLQDSTLERLLNWHLAKLRRQKRNDIS
jgi:hypothetical protein